jgi:hypothetical protein
MKRIVEIQHESEKRNSDGTAVYRFLAGIYCRVFKIDLLHVECKAEVSKAIQACKD